jgi:hypothetical protein
MAGYFMMEKNSVKSLTAPNVGRTGTNMRQNFQHQVRSTEMSVE